MPIWILGFIAFVIVFFALGLHRRRKPDVAGVNAAMEAQRQRLLAQRKAEIERACGHDLRVLSYCYVTPMIDKQYELSRKVSSASAHALNVREIRSELASSARIIETAISAQDLGDASKTCSPEVLQYLKGIHEQVEKRFVAAQSALRNERQGVESLIETLQDEAINLREWMSVRAEAVKEQAQTLIDDVETAVSDQRRRNAVYLDALKANPDGIEKKERITPGVTKWREERRAAREQMALTDSRFFGSRLMGISFRKEEAWNPLAKAPVEI